MATITKNRKNSLSGIIIEVLGFVIILLGLFMVFIEGYPGAVALLLIGVTNMIYGFMKSWKSICSECRNIVEDKEVRICTVCKATFE